MLFAAFLVGVAPAALAAQPSGGVPTVMVVFSLRSTAPSVAEMEPTFRRALASTIGSNVDLHVEYLDLSDSSSPACEKQLVALLREKYAARRFDVLITDRPEALGFVLRHRTALFTGVPVVFTDVTRESAGTLSLPPDVTGTYLVTEHLRTARVALELHPTARKVVLVGGASTFDREREPTVRRQVRAASSDIEIVSLIGQPLDEQVRVVSGLSRDSVVIFTTYRADSLGRSMVAADVIGRIAEASAAPVYGSSRSWLGDGMVGGDLIRYDRLAEHASVLANRVLRGEAAIAITEETASDLMFDWRQLQRWDIDESVLPAGSIVMFRIPTAFETYRWYVVGFLAIALAQAFLIGALLVERSSRRRAQAVAVQGVRDLRVAFEKIERLREQLEVDNSYLTEELQLKGDIEGIVGRSDALVYVLGKARQVAGTSSTVLLLGETGVGKDLVATAIHNLSPRRGRPLIRVNCAALPPTLIESELFGHEKGAFTGAAALRKGRFEVAHGTTLFLDEVGELPLELQAKLLRVLQDGEFERVGGNTTLRTDVRVIAATNRQLLDEVRAGRFREDLWYRLCVFPITIPPLRQRRDDIPLLVHHFVGQHCRRLGRPPLAVTKATLRDLQSREWIGNVRELASVIERGVIVSRDPTLQLGDETAAPGSAAPRADGAKTLAQAEREHIVATLERAGWRLEGEGGAAALLGVNPSTLRSRMLKHGIRRPGSVPSAPAAPVVN